MIIEHGAAEVPPTVVTILTAAAIAPAGLAIVLTFQAAFNEMNLDPIGWLTAPITRRAEALVHRKHAVALAAAACASAGAAASASSVLSAALAPVDAQPERTNNGRVTYTVPQAVKIEEGGEDALLSRLAVIREEKRKLEKILANRRLGDPVDLPPSQQHVGSRVVEDEGKHWCATA